jgi:hypothetical protein
VNAEGFQHFFLYPMKKWVPGQKKGSDIQMGCVHTGRYKKRGISPSMPLNYVCGSPF